VEGCKKTINDGSRDYNRLRRRREWLLAFDYEEAIFGDGGHVEITLNVFNVCQF
jgi:hypothetical protein